MTPDMIYLKALIRNAEKLPKDALPYLGWIAYSGLCPLSKAARRCFFKGIAAMFGCTPASHKKGMRLLLKVSELDYDNQCEVIRHANRLRQMVSASVELPVTVRNFFGALERAKSLRAYFDTHLNLHEADGDIIPSSMMDDDTAFMQGGWVSSLIENNEPIPAAPVPALSEPLADGLAPVSAPAVTALPSTLPTEPLIAPSANYSKPRVDQNRFTVYFGDKSCFLGNTLLFALFDRLNQQLGEYVHWHKLAVDVWKDRTIERQDRPTEKATVQRTVSILRHELTEAGMVALKIDGQQKGHYRLLIIAEP